MMAVKKKINKLLSSTALCCGFWIATAQAAELDMNTAQMQAMDKITGRVSVINVPVNGEVEFGSFSIVVRACKTRPPEETPENFAFVDVVDQNNNEQPMNIFRGWMMSSTPGLNAVEHPIYDVWLLKCMDTDISKAKLLSAVELKDRDGMPKAPQMTERAEYKSSAPQEANVDMAVPIAAVTETIIEKTIETQPIDEIKSIEEVPQENLEPMMVPDNTPAEDGAPKSLLNMGNLPNETAPAAVPSEAPIQAEPINIEPQNLESVPVVNPLISEPEDVNFVDEGEAVEEMQSTEAPANVELPAPETPKMENSEFQQLIEFTD